MKNLKSTTVTKTISTGGVYDICLSVEVIFDTDNNFVQLAHAKMPLLNAFVEELTDEISSGRFDVDAHEWQPFEYLELNM